MNKQSFTDALATLVAVQYARTEEPENEALLVADLSRVLARTVALVSHAKMDQAEVLLEAAILVMRMKLKMAMVSEEKLRHQLARAEQTLAGGETRTTALAHMRKKFGKSYSEERLLRQTQQFIEMALQELERRRERGEVS